MQNKIFRSFKVWYSLCLYISLPKRNIISYSINFLQSQFIPSFPINFFFFFTKTVKLEANRNTKRKATLGEREEEKERDRGRKRERENDERVKQIIALIIICIFMKDWVRINLKVDHLQRSQHHADTNKTTLCAMNTNFYKAVYLTVLQLSLPKELNTLITGICKFYSKRESLYDHWRNLYSEKIFMGIKRRKNSTDKTWKISLVVSKFKEGMT